MPEPSRTTPWPPYFREVTADNIYFESIEFIALQDSFGYGIRLTANDPDVSYQPICYATDLRRGMSAQEVLWEARESIASQCNRLRAEGNQGAWIRNPEIHANLSDQRRRLNSNVCDELTARYDNMGANRSASLYMLADWGTPVTMAIGDETVTMADRRGDTIHVRAPRPVSPVSWTRPDSQRWVNESWAMGYGMRTGRYLPAKRGGGSLLRHTLSCFNLVPPLNFKHRTEWIAAAEAKRARRKMRATKEMPPRSELVASLKRLLRDETPHNTRSRT